MQTSLAASVPYRVCLFEDRGVSTLEPLTLTRPAWELLCGMTSLGAKQCRFFAPAGAGPRAHPDGVLLRSYLAALYRQRHPETSVNETTWLRAAPTVLVNGRWLPPPGRLTDRSEPCVGLVGDEVAYAVVGPRQLTYCSLSTLEDCLATWKTTLPVRPAGGRLFAYLWDLVEHNAEQLRVDYEEAVWTSVPPPGPFVPAVVGPPERLLVAPTARIDPLVVADTTRGPVVIEADAVVTAFTRLEGPCHVGPSAQVLGAKVRGGTTLGPHCRVGGEVEASIFQGYSNKYHDGFLGHSYVGEWVNLGAGTQNSDLRNDYGEVAVVVNGQAVATGQTKVGCFLGDHTRTGLAALLNTGTNAGVFTNLLPTGGYLPKFVPSFCSVWNGHLADKADLTALLHSAARVMQRRDCVFSEAYAELVRFLFERTAPQRRQALREAEIRRLRRSA